MNRAIQLLTAVYMCIYYTLHNLEVVYIINELRYSVYTPRSSHHSYNYIITEELFQCTEICVTILIKFINFIILPDFLFYEEKTLISIEKAIIMIIIIIIISMLICIML